MRGEFDLIATYFAPLAADAPGALGLSDDGAVLPADGDRARVFTVDTLIADVHFLAHDPPASIACKALRVNLSDLAAMGARPVGYLLSLALGQGTDEAWVAGFAEGLTRDQASFAVSLLGGDTTRTPGPTTLSITAIGSLDPGAGARRAGLRRNGARVGERVYVSGSIGDAVLGLDVARGALGQLSDADAAHLVDRYRYPRPRVALGQALWRDGLATAAADVSDGLIADLGHICRQSGVGARLAVPKIPLSAAVQRRAELDADVLRRAVTGGDDYELVFTAPANHATAIAALATRLDLPLTCIGEIVDGTGVALHDAEGAELPLDTAGWTHF